MHTKKVNECAVLLNETFFESRIVMSCPRCVDSVSIRILWLRSTYVAFEAAAVASERSIFSKKHDYNTYNYI